MIGKDMFNENWLRNLCALPVKLEVTFEDAEDICFALRQEATRYKAPLKNERLSEALLRLEEYICKQQEEASREYLGH